MSNNIVNIKTQFFTEYASKSILETICVEKNLLVEQTAELWFTSWLLTPSTWRIGCCYRFENNSIETSVVVPLPRMFRRLPLITHCWSSGMIFLTDLFVLRLNPAGRETRLVNRPGISAEPEPGRYGTCSSSWRDYTVKGSTLLNKRHSSIS